MKQNLCQEGCGAWIVRARALSVHYASVHKEDRRFYCITCEVFFSRYVDFGKHSKYLHEIPMWESEHYTTRVYNEGVDSCEPVFIKYEVK